MDRSGRPTICIRAYGLQSWDREIRLQLCFFCLPSLLSTKGQHGIAGRILGGLGPSRRFLDHRQRITERGSSETDGKHSETLYQGGRRTSVGPVRWAAVAAFPPSKNAINMCGSGCSVVVLAIITQRRQTNPANGGYGHGLLWPEHVPRIRKQFITVSETRFLGIDGKRRRGRRDSPRPRCTGTWIMGVRKDLMITERVPFAIRTAQPFTKRFLITRSWAILTMSWGDTPDWGALGQYHWRA